MWMLTDRRVSFAGRPPREDAIKVLRLCASDGDALLGYSGLGVTIGGVEPSAWMSRVLRGVNAPLEACLERLRQAVGSELPPHLHSVTAGVNAAHTIMASAFRNGRPRMYMIDLRIDRQAQTARHAFYRAVTPSITRVGEKAEGGVLVALGGSGGLTLYSSFGFDPWGKNLRKVIKAHDMGKVSAAGVAAHLARLNCTVHGLDGSVGPRSIVSWQTPTDRNGKEFFDGCDVEPQPEGFFLPSLSRGMDNAAVLGAMLEQHRIPLYPGQTLEERVALMMDAVRRLPGDPDQTLR